MARSAHLRPESCGKLLRDGVGCKCPLDISYRCDCSRRPNYIRPSISPTATSSLVCIALSLRNWSHFAIFHQFTDVAQLLGFDGSRPDALSGTVACNPWPRADNAGTLAFQGRLPRDCLHDVVHGRRQVGSIRNPNSIGLILLGLCSAALAIRPLAIRFVCLGTCIILLLATQSRSAVISTLLMLTIYVALEWKAIGRVGRVWSCSGYVLGLSSFPGR